MEESNQENHTSPDGEKGLKELGRVVEVNRDHGRKEETKGQLEESKERGWSRGEVEQRKE